MPDALVPPATTASLMTASLMTAQLLASGAHWRVREVTCRAGPSSPLAEERHEWTGVAVVASGTFTYRSDAGRGMLFPGAMLLANAGACFECGHEHGTGDVCISFQYAPPFVENAFARFRGHRRRRFPTHVLPPLPATIPLTARAIARGAATCAVDELATEILDAAVGSAHDGQRQSRPDARDARTVSRLAREISGAPHASWSLTTMAATTGMDEFRLLRAFKRVAGITPYSYVLRQRLEAAASMLLKGAVPVHEVALFCGFNDLSEFNRRFRRHFGLPPMRFRKKYCSGVATP